MIEEDLTEDGTLLKVLKMMRERVMGLSGVGMFQAEGRASAKALRQELT